MGSALERLRDRKKAAQRIIPICMNADLVSQHETLKGRLDTVRKSAGVKPSEATQNDLARLEDEIESVAAEIREDCEWFKVRAMAPDAYDDLINEHPPTKEQKQDARKQMGPRATLQWNNETFPDALMAATVVVLTRTGWDDDEEPVFDGSEDPLTLDFITEMRQGGQWNTGEISTLLQASFSINDSVSNIAAAGNG